MESRARWVLVLYGLLALVVWPVYPRFQSPNELTRWAFLGALVEKGSAEVGSMLPFLSPGFEDLSVVDGRTYSNKAPGAALVALPGYLAARPFTGPPSETTLRPQLTAMRLAGATLPLLALAALLPWAAARMGAETTRAPVVVFALLFATPLFAYGLLLFAHALAAGCVFGAWAVLFAPAPREAVVRRELLAGALMGLAVVTEYPMAVPCLVLFGFALARRSLARALRVAAGGLPFAVGLLLYNRACFGGFLELSSAHEKYGSFQELAGAGLFGIGLPSAQILWGLLASGGKGLLVFSPFLALSLPALVIMSFILPRDAFRAYAATPLSILLVYGGYPNWHGGWTVGARYLCAIVPFLVFPLAFRRGGRLEAALLGWSALACGLTGLVFPFVPLDYPLPWGSFSLPLILRGLLAPNAWHLVARPLALAVPLGLVVAAAAVALRGRARPALLGAAASLLAGLLALRTITLGERAHLAFVEEVYFERVGAMERALEPVPVPRVLTERRDEQRRHPPGSWRF